MTDVLFRAPRRDPRHVRRSRARIARYADLQRRAGTPVERFDVAVQAVRAAIKNARSNGNGRRAARAERDELAKHANYLIGHARLPERSATHHRAKLNAPGSDLARLGRSMACLRGVVARLLESEQDRFYDSYATHLMATARRIESEGR